jgi:hypothetical protein
MKTVELDAACDSDAVNNAAAKFDKYLSRVGYSFDIVMFSPV